MPGVLLQSRAWLLPREHTPIWHVVALMASILAPVFAMLRRLRKSGQATQVFDAPIRISAVLTPIQVPMLLVLVVVLRLVLVLSNVLAQGHNTTPATSSATQSLWRSLVVSGSAIGCRYAMVATNARSLGMLGKS